MAEHFEIIRMLLQNVDKVSPLDSVKLGKSVTDCSRIPILASKKRKFSKTRLSWQSIIGFIDFVANQIHMLKAEINLAFWY